MFKHKRRFHFIGICFFVLLFFSTAFRPDWGFFGHKRINHLAVFTLPSEMIGFYKENIGYLTAHAVDPDKRRYASKFEAVRHYIDLDHWGKAPFDNVPRKWVDAIGKYLQIYAVQNNGDTVQIHLKAEIGDENIANSPLSTMPAAYRDFVYQNILNQYYEDDWNLDCDSLASLQKAFPHTQIPNCQSAFAIDGFSAYGIVPYHLEMTQRRLTKAFKEGDAYKILRLSTEFGHYIGDAHVPLHTTENYNGQMTNQVGIHAFWESRLPELFADNEYDFFVGQASYIEDPNAYYWNVVFESHAYVESLLEIERDLKATFPSDQQFCFEVRGNSTIRTQCEAFCRKYHNLLDGQVERRMTKAIHAIGSAWYTAWVDAGQPDLSHLQQNAPSESEVMEQKELQQKYQSGKIIGRQHGQ